MTDFELLAEYVKTRSDAAFAQLMLRHVDLVYSAALRQTGDPEAADEITQAVFVVLAQKARTLQPRDGLAPWLYNATRIAVLDGRRQAARRRRHELGASLAGGKRAAETPPGDAWNEIASMLDDAVAALPAKERAALVLRYFENRSIEAVSLELGVSREAAAKRVTRALGKLRDYFERRGKSLALPALAVLIGGHAVHAAPADVSAALAANVAAAKSGSARASWERATGVLRVMATLQMLRRVRAVAVFGVLALLLFLLFQRGAPAPNVASNQTLEMSIEIERGGENRAAATDDSDQSVRRARSSYSNRAPQDAQDGEIIAQEVWIAPDPADAAKTRIGLTPASNLTVDAALRARAAALEKLEAAKKAAGRSTGSESESAPRDTAAANIADSFLPTIMINNGASQRPLLFQEAPGGTNEQRIVYRALIPRDPQDAAPNKAAPEAGGRGLLTAEELKRVLPGIPPPLWSGLKDVGK